MSKASSAHVHHMFVHMCASITDLPNPAGTHCNQAPRDVRECLTNRLIAAWTVGGEVGVVFLKFHMLNGTDNSVKID